MLTLTTARVAPCRKWTCACAHWDPCWSKGYVDPKVLDILIGTCVGLAACELLLH